MGINTTTHNSTLQLQQHNQLQTNPSNQHFKPFKMETVKNTANYISETIQGATATTSKEANKQVAKDSDASLSTRASAGIDAAKDKLDESYSLHSIIMTLAYRDGWEDSGEVMSLKLMY